MESKKINIASLNIDVQSIIRDASLTKKSIDELKNAQKILTKEGQTSSEQFITNAATLKRLNAEYGASTKVISSLTNENGKLIKTEEALNGAITKTNKTEEQAKANNKELIQLRQKLDTSTEKGIKTRDEINAKIDKNNALIKENVSGLEQQRLGIGGYEKGIVSALKNQNLFGISVGDTAEQLLMKRNAMAASTQATTTGTKALKLFKVALASTGIGLLLVALGSLVAFFNSSEEGQARLNKIMRTAGVIIGNISDVFADFGEVVLNAITKPGEAWQGFVERFKSGYEFIRRQVIDRFEGRFDQLVGNLNKGVAQIELAWAKLSGSDSKIDAARKKIEEANQRVIEGQLKIAGANKEVAESFDQITNSVKGFIDETRTEISEAQRLADLELETNRLEREALVDRAKAEAVIADLRLKAKKEDEFTAEARLKFLREAGDLQDSLAEKDAVIAKNRLELRRIENSFSKSTQDNLDEEARLEAEVFRVEAARLNQRRTIEREIQRTRRQASSEELANQKKLQKAEQDRLLALFTAKQDQLELEEELARQELQLLQDELEEEQEIKKAFEEIEKTRQRELREDKLLEEDLAFDQKMLRLQEQGATEFEFRKAQLEEQRSAEEENAKKTIKNKDLLEQALSNIETKYRIQSATIATEVEIAKAQAIAGIAGGLAQLFGAESSAGKAASIAQATINTFTAATEALPNPALVAATIATGLATVARIAGIDTGNEFQGIAQIAGNISNLGQLNLPKAEKGALFEIGGKRHSSGGTKFYGEDGTSFEAERGELIGVMSRKASQHFMGFNDKFTAKSSYVPNVFQEGGIVQRGIQSGSTGIDSGVIEEAIYKGAFKGTREGSFEGVIEASEQSSIANGSVL